MEIICFEKKAFEEFAAKIERFLQRVSEMPGLKGVGIFFVWLDHYEVRRKLRFSKRTVQTLRVNGTRAYTNIGNRTYYLPDDVERIVTKVEDRRREARYKGRTV